MPPSYRPRRAACAILSLGLALGSGTVGASAAAYTGTGGGPATTINAPYRSSVGQTVPAGRAAAPEIDPNERTTRQQKLDPVIDSICRGC